MNLDHLPRLSDDDRTALDDGYVAIECALTGVPPVDSPNFERWRNQVLLDSARARPQTN
jgi:hypothetical protein